MPGCRAIRMAGLIYDATPPVMAEFAVLARDLWRAADRRLLRHHARASGRHASGADPAPRKPRPSAETISACITRAHGPKRRGTEQRKLVARVRRRRELAAIQRLKPPLSAPAAAAQGESAGAAGQPRAPRRALRIAETRVVVAPAAHRLHLRHDMRGLAGVMAVKPVAKQRRHLKRQPQGDHAGGRAPASVAVWDALISCAVRTGITSAIITRTGTPASDGRRIIRSRVAGDGARLHLPGQSGVKRGQRNPDRRQPARPHRPSRSASRITVAPRVTSATGWFQSCSTWKQPRMMPAVALDGLIGVGIGAKGQRRDRIAAPPDLGPAPRGIGFGGDAGFKIQPRRQAQIGVAGRAKQ